MKATVSSIAFLMSFIFQVLIYNILMILLVLLFAENEQGIFDAILRGHLDFSSEPWPSISSSAKDLVKKMLRADPKERLSAVQVLSNLQLFIPRDIKIPLNAHPSFH